MKNFFVFLLAAVLWLCETSDARALNVPLCESEQNCDRNAQDLEKFVKVFYIWYGISTYENGEAWDSPAMNWHLKEALSPDFYHALKKRLETKDSLARDMREYIPYEPIQYAEEYDYNWLFSKVKLTHMGKQGASLAATFTSSDATTYTLNVELKVVEGQWRIDKITSEDFKE